MLNDYYVLLKLSVSLKRKERTFKYPKNIEKEKEPHPVNDHAVLNNETRIEAGIGIGESQIVLTYTNDLLDRSERNFSLSTMRQELNADKFLPVYAEV